MTNDTLTRKMLTWAVNERKMNVRAYTIRTIIYKQMKQNKKLSSWHGKRYIIYKRVQSHVKRGVE